jgi:Flp pilus assembly protein TadD
MPSRSGIAVVAGTVLVLSVSACSSQRRSAGSTSPSTRRAPQAVAIAMDRQIRNAIDAGEGDPLIRHLRQKVAADPDHLAARLELAAQYQKHGAHELAIDHLRFAVAHRPNDENVVRRLAGALQANEQPLESIAALVAYCESHPETASAGILEELAILEDEAGALAEGERFHRRAIAADGRDDRLRNNLGFNFLQQSRLEDAAHEFRAALQLNPASEAARNNLALALAKLGQTEEAILQWSSILGPAAAHNNLATVWIEKGDLPAARKEIQIALDYDRHNPAAMQNLQLMSELDGKPASFTMSSKDSRRTAATGWGRISALFGRILNPETKEQAPAAGKTADKREQQ